jgi:hypothetical protein
MQGEGTVMSRAGAMFLWAASLLLGAVSGCTLDSTSLNVFAATSEHEQVISGSVQSVASSAEGKLLAMNVFVNKTKEGDSIRLSSCTKAGNKFALVFNRVKGPNSEQTRINIEWEDKADLDFWLQFVEDVANAQLGQDAKQPH